MAGQKAVWGIDIGQCALKAVKLSYDAKEDKAVVEAFDFVEHPKILSQPDAEPEELIRSALEQFLSRNDVDEDLIYLSVPGQAGLARFVKLPPVEAKKVNDIVRFEANQQIPFNLNEVVWDHQTIGGGEETEGYLVDAEVGIFAIKKDTVNRYLVPLERAGIEVSVVQLSPVALYNFAAFDQFLHASQKIEAAAPPSEGAAPEQAEEEAKPSEEGAEEEGDTVVILDIGADNTDLVVTNGDSIWLRNLPIGGNHFTRALTKELKLTFAKAEHMKRNVTKAPDPKKLYHAMRPVFQDFVSELQRSIGFFSSTNRNRVIRKVIGVGNGFKLPGLQKFLQQHLQYEVDKVSGFHGLKGDCLAEPVFQENLPSFCVAYGLALQGLKQTPVQTNLLPREIRTQRLVRNKKPYTLLAAAMVLVAFVATFFVTFNAYSAVKNPALKTAKTGADSAVTEFKKLKTDFESAKGEFKKALDDGAVNLGLKDGERRLDWIKAIKYLNEAIPKRGPDDLELKEIKELNIDFLLGAFRENTGDWYNQQFLGDVGATAKNTMTEADAKAGPAGEGWVFQLLGYTYNKEGLQLVRQTLLASLQSPRMRDRGFSHACIFWYERDSKWTPKKGSLSGSRPKITEVLKSSGGGQSGGGGNNGMAGLGGSGGGAGFASGPSGPMYGPGSGMGNGPMGGGGMGMSGGQMGMSGGQMGVMGGKFRMGGGMNDGGAMGRMGGGRGEELGMEDFMPPEMGGVSGDGAAKAVEKAIERTDFEIQLVWTPNKKSESAAAK